MTKSIAEFAAEAREIQISKGWRKLDGSDDRTFGDHIALIHSELSEALEAYRSWGLSDATGPSAAEAMNPNLPELPKPEGVGSEFADTFIRLIEACDVYGIDLEAEVERKLAHNRTREWRHGGRAL